MHTKFYKKKMPVYIVIAAIIIIAGLLYFGTHRITVKKYSIAIDSLSAEFEGYTILHLSDLYSKRYGKNQQKLFESIYKQQFDLVLVGHTHGGQIRIPFIGAVYVLGQVFSPKYDYGMYSSGQTTMVINAGSGESVIPRSLLFPRKKWVF